MSTGIALVWEEPPPEEPQERALSRWEQIAKALVENPREWAIVAEGYNSNQTRSAINNGKNKACAAQRGTFETRLVKAYSDRRDGMRNYDGDKLYARYIPIDSEDVFVRPPITTRSK